MAYTTIDDPSQYFYTQLYTGNGSTQSITNNANAGDFQPDWVWIKNRSASDQHNLYDSTRGATKRIESSNTGAESTKSNGLTSFDSDGFSVGSADQCNGNSENLVAWQWKANGGTTSTNTAGTNIDTTVQANTTAGFSIMTYTGTGTDNDSIGHGLGAVPHWIIVKNRDETNGWQTYHHKNTSAPETDYLKLESTNATADDHDRWSDQAPSSTVITLGGNDGVSKASTNYVCYAWTEIQGYSKFGSYTGNGNADGPFVYTGFKPAWLLIKESSGVEDWRLYDNKRSPLNVMDDQLFPNSTSSEATSSSYNLDFLSNGFKLRSSHGGYNTSSDIYVYMAFAEHPFVSSKGVPVTAR
jgi:hypothetical protein